MEILWNIDLTITLFLQSLGGWLSAPMKLFSFFGQEQFFLLVIPAIYWCLDSGFGFRIGAMLLISGGLNSYLKVLFHSPRPYWFSTRVHAYSIETSYGLPSGHAQIASSIWGLMAALLRRRGAWITALVFIFLIGLSRIYLGVHFTEDVLLGWLIGALLVIAFLRFERPVYRWLMSKTPTVWIVLGFLSSLALIGLQIVFTALTSTFSIPPAWAQNALVADANTPIDPLAISGMLTNAGLWFGLAVGATWLWARGGYCAKGTPSQLGTRFALGLAGVLVLYAGLKLIFPSTEDWLGYGLRYLRYALIGIWVSGGAPLLFIRLGIATRKAEPAEITGEMAANL